MLSQAAKSQFTVELYSNAVLDTPGEKKKKKKKKSPAVTQEFVIQSHLSFEGWRGENSFGFVCM